MSHLRIWSRGVLEAKSTVSHWNAFSLWGHTVPSLLPPDHIFGFCRTCARGQGARLPFYTFSWISLELQYYGTAKTDLLHYLASAAANELPVSLHIKWKVSCIASLIYIIHFLQNLPDCIPLCIRIVTMVLPNIWGDIELSLESSQILLDDRCLLLRMTPVPLSTQSPFIRQSQDQTLTSLQLGLEELWDRQHQLTAVLMRGRVSQILEDLADKSRLADASAASTPWDFANRWNSENLDELHTCPKVDTIKVMLRRICSSYATTISSGSPIYYQCSAMKHCVRPLTRALKALSLIPVSSWNLQKRD